MLMLTVGIVVLILGIGFYFWFLFERRDSNYLFLSMLLGGMGVILVAGGLLRIWFP